MLFEELNEQLAEVKNQQHKRRKWKAQIADYEAEHQQQQQTLSDLKSKMEEDQADIEKLEELSFSHLLAVLTGSTDERIRDKQEVIAATKLKYDETQHALPHIEQSIQDIREKLGELPDIDRDYQRIMQKKEKLMADTPRTVLTRRYDEVTEEVADLQSFLTETTEAIKAGEKVNRPLDEAIEALEKAKGWGGLDLFGGGAFITHLKHNHIDAAKESIHEAQMKMRMFHKELLDIHKESDMNIEIQGLLTFANFFFDGIFINYVVQGKIEESLENVKEKQNEIDKIIFQLNVRYDRKEKEFKRLKKEKKTILEDFGA